ncbi:transcription termination factor NusA [Candidatus Gracilibacteria bacterium]|nr:transcription termination factor NusA [Candidatus Gracilibacteria bacterium]
MLDLKQIQMAVTMIAKEKKIPEEKIIDIIEAALKTAYKKDYGNKDEEVNVKLDFENEAIEISLEKTVVKEVENEYTEISLEEAEGFEEGDVIEIDVTDEVMSEENAASFGRIASQAARQVIIQKIADSEKEKIYDLFEGREGEVVNMKVELVEGGKVIFDYNGNQVVLPKSEQSSKDVYTPGIRFSLYVAEVSKTETGAPRVILSRKRAELVSALFAEQVSEIGEGVISIDNIVRQPGLKTKILVSTTYDEIDPVGTLIGQKGMRVKSIMDEIGGEKIDIIPNGNPELVLKKALSPANVIKVDANEEELEADVYILPSDRAKAVGKNGMNVNLASKLTGYKISIIDLDVPANDEDEGEEKKEEA